jgi:hypothetical protein
LIADRMLQLEPRFAGLFVGRRTACDATGRAVAHRQADQAWPAAAGTIRDVHCKLSRWCPATSVRPQPLAGAK